MIVFTYHLLHLIGLLEQEGNSPWPDSLQAQAAIPEAAQSALKRVAGDGSH